MSRKRGRRARRVGLVAAGCIALCAAPAGAQYVAPPPDPGFQYIFDGTTTGSAASFDKWTFSSTTAAASATQGRATVDPAQGAIQVGASPFGGYWYPVRAFGDAVLRLQYTVQNTPTSTRNGGIVVRAPDVRYTGANTAAVLAQKPTGYNYDACPGATVFCGLQTPALSTTYTWAGAPGPFPPPSSASDPPFAYSGTYCSRPGVNNVTNLAGTGLAPTGNDVANQQHWSQLYCGHEVQVNESLNGGGPNPSTDPIKTGSIYGFRNLNAKQSRTNERLEKGVWHDLEIRTIGQQYTVFIDGRFVNQFDNAVPKIATAEWGGGYPPTMARQLARGYIGLQTHGGNDRISYREIQVKEITPQDIPVNVTPPSVIGPGFTGQPLTCATGTWQKATDTWITWYRSNKIGPEHPRYRAPSQFDLGNFTTPAEAEFGTSPLPWTDSLLVGEGATYVPTAADVGKVIHCTVSADNAGATVMRTAAAPAIITAVGAEAPVGGTVPATLSLTLGQPAAFAPFVPGVANVYSATLAANVITTAGDAALSVSDATATAPGRLVNGAFALAQPLRARASSAAGGPGQPFAPLPATANTPLTVLTYAAPTTNDAVTLHFDQAIGAAEPLRTGAYSKTLTFTLSTNTP